ncbi:MAG: hypothetical protein KAH18_10375 [Psychromonas sp.]|nr:hypothetical protein [Psychromonas sp.]
MPPITISEANHFPVKLTERGSFFMLDHFSIVATQNEVILTSKIGRLFNAICINNGFIFH